MRSARWSLVAALALGICTLANAQSANVPSFSNNNNFSSALTGIRPSDVKFRQIDTGKLSQAPIPTVQTVSQNRFSFSGIFRKITGIGQRPVRGVSPLPDPRTVPGWQFPDSPIKPMLPIIPGR